MESKKIILLATASEHKAKWFEKSIMGHVSGATIFRAHDGLEAWNKLQNVPPHMVVCDMDLPKLAGIKLVGQALARKGSDSMSFLLIGQLPQNEIYLDELVSGQVQFWAGEGDEKDLHAILVRALNYSAKHDKAEFHLRFMSQGDVLMREGESGDYVYFVKKGQLQASRKKDTGRVVLGTVEVGEFVGEMSYIHKEARSADVVALTDCELIEVPIQIFGKVLFQRPTWSKTLMVTLSNRLKAANETRAAKP